MNKKKKKNPLPLMILQDKFVYAPVVDFPNNSFSTQFCAF